MNFRKEIHAYLVTIESGIRYLTDRNYYTLATRKRGMWALLVYYFIPQLVCMLNLYEDEYGIPDYFEKNGFMLPILQEGNIISPTLLLKKYLKSNVKDIGQEHNEFTIHKYINNLRNDFTPSQKSKHLILKELQKNKDNSVNIQEIESIINCAIISSKFYHEACNYFGNSNYAFMLIEYFRKCLTACHTASLCLDFIYDPQSLNEFEAFMLFNLEHLKVELDYTNPVSELIIRENYDSLKRYREINREELFHAFKAYLYETSELDIDVLESIDIDTLSNGILRYNPDHEIQALDREHEEIIRLLKKLEYTFKNPDNKLNEEVVLRILENIKLNKYYLNYEQEFLYFYGLSFLAKNDFLNAIKQFVLVQNSCKEITAGETNIKATELLITLRFLTDNKISYSNLNPEIQAIIDAQSEEVIMIPFANPNEDERHRKVYFDKVLNIIQKFNAFGYCCYDGIECVKYNPFTKFEAFLSDFFEQYDNINNISNNNEERALEIIESLVKGRRAKHTLKKPVVAMFQYTIAEAFEEY